MTVQPNDNFKLLEIESKLLPVQIKTEKVNELDNFKETEKKKYKKTDEVEDLINNFDNELGFADTIYK